ncbi:tellurite resistance TerB family protein [Exercitatus varius]|uniref:tellurite resistance TerB family protein n=1 Tax=Exercitatus varius TaxID=67857 RepID=UPI00294AED90|nr:DUF533 domain-containing protein [Exercitatus varius]MDG2941956.1 DUF533 domain-containing protein [Exercitatus varius]
MDFNKILNQVFTTAQQQVSKTMSGNSTMDKITKAGGGAAAIGILSMILGRSGGASLTKLGSLAALGSLAYQAYQSYQAKQGQAPQVEETNFSESAKSSDAGRVILQAMIAAAAADGAISEEEKQAILNEANNDADVQQWLEQAINSPATPEQIAAQVGNDAALAAQVYLAARVACKELDRKEIVFLSKLAQALGLDDQLVEELEKRAGF